VAIVLYTALLTISIEFIIHFILSKKYAKKTLKNEDEKLAEKISATFVFSHESAIDYFFNLSKKIIP
jgi:glycerol-3-phosphate O-acyltransferase